MVRGPGKAFQIKSSKQNKGCPCCDLNLLICVKKCYLVVYNHKDDGT